MPFEDERYRAAYQWAKAQGVQKGYPPGEVPDRLLDDLIRQWLAAHPARPETDVIP